jgi:two-component system alkaline phosphatase synthesis response regulator PhoP
MAYKVLFVEENSDFLPKLVEHGKKHRFNYKFFSITPDTDVTEYILANNIDLILLSCSLNREGKSALDYIKLLKFQSSTFNIPLIQCTIGLTVNDHVKFLNAGADDCYNKTLPLELLFSKMNAMLRKINKDRNDKNNMLRKFYFIEDSLEVEFGGHRHRLTNKEFIILKTLVENPNTVYSQEDLNKLTSGADVFISRRCIDTFITLLRRKIGKDSIVSIRKKGYKLNDNLVEEALKSAMATEPQNGVSS